MLRMIVAAASLALVAACATPTPYQPVGRDGTPYGYSEFQIEPERFRITFTGNSITDRETVENYLLYRAAELTLQSGYDYFMVADRDTEAERRYRASSFGSYRSRWGFYPFYSFYQPAFGWYDPFDPFGPAYDVNIRETTRYQATAEVRFGRGPTPPTANAFDARQVERNLRGTTVPQIS